MKEILFPSYGQTVLVDDKWITMSDWFSMTVPAQGRPQIVYIMFTSPNLLNTGGLTQYFFVVKIALYSNVAIMQSITKLGKNPYDDDTSASARKFFMNNPKVASLKSSKIYFVGEVTEHTDLMGDVKALAQGRLATKTLFKPKF